MLALRITLRYLRTRRIALVAAFSMALSVTAMIVITAVMDGFRASIHGQIRGVEADLSVRLDGAGADHSERVAAMLAGEVGEGRTISALAPRIEAFGLIWSQAKSGDPDAGNVRLSTATEGVRIIGIDFDSESEVLNLEAMIGQAPQWLRPSEPITGRAFEEAPVPLVIVSSRLAQKLRLVPLGTKTDYRTDQVTLMTGRRETKGREEQIEPHSMHFKVIGAYETDRADFDERHVFVDRYVLLRLMHGLVPPPSTPNATAVTARLAADFGGDIEEFAQRLEAGYPGLQVETWRDRNRDLLSALDVEKTTVSLVLGLIVLITASLILGLLYLLVLEKTRDIGALRAMGMSGREVIAVFVLYATVLGIIGSGLGTWWGIWAVRELSAIMTWANSAFGFQVFDQSVDYAFDDLPTILDPNQVLVIALVALGLAILAGALAAWRASRLDPVQCLRTE